MIYTIIAKCNVLIGLKFNNGLFIGLIKKYTKIL